MSSNLSVSEPETSGNVSKGGGNSSSLSNGLSSVGNFLSSVSSPLASILSSIGNIFLSNQRNEQAIEQWKRENEYNLPKNQIQRLKEAGLNPALMYVNGTSGLVSAQSPELSMGNVNLRGVDPLTAAQIRNLDTDSSLKQANADLAESQALTETEKQANLKAQTSNFKKMNSILDEEKTKVHWEGQYLEHLTGKTYVEGKILFQEWYAGFKTLTERIAAMLAEYDYANSHYGLQKESEIIQLGNLPAMMQANLRNAEEMFNVYKSSEYRNYAEGSASLQNAVSNRINAESGIITSHAAYMNAWTNDFNAQTMRSQAVATIQKCYQETQSLMNQNSLFGITKYADIFGSYTNAIGNVFGFKLLK